MLEEINNLKDEIKSKLEQVSTPEELDQFRLNYLVRKGAVQAMFERMREVPNEQKPAVGKELNQLRNLAESEFARLSEEFARKSESTPDIDLSLPGRRSFRGAYHPVMQVLDRMTGIFIHMGFEVAQGPEIEDDEHNFDALNFPPNHPARDLQDTFFMAGGDDLVLRTHTSPVQIRVMRAAKPPIRCIMPGRVYRNEAINARSLAEFHQVEGLYVDKNVTFAELKATIIDFARQMYGQDSKFRFRPHFFPFTEPSAEMDISCYLCGGKGCRVCKHTGWLEIAGCGMVHPNVLRACDIDPEEYSGFAFGFGIERVAMLGTDIKDIRFFYDNDVRVLGQF
ncbi:MAG: phenylalanine--tRNA ligase subunit alpha [Candidatus Kapaibacterium sp.]